MKTIEEVRSEIERIAHLIGADRYPERGDFKCLECVPACGDEVMAGRRGTKDAEVARILVDADGYHILSRERGAEGESKVTLDFDELLYWSFEKAIDCVASDYVYSHNFYDKGQDPRRRTNIKEVDLYALISPGCAQRRVAKIMRDLERRPYDDNRAERVARYQELTFRRSREDAWQAAQEQYPPMQPTQPFPPFLRVSG